MDFGLFFNFHWQKFIKNAKNGQFWRVFENLKLAVKQCYQTGQKLVENAKKLKKYKWDILGDFQTLCTRVKEWWMTDLLKPFPIDFQKTPHELPATFPWWQKMLIIIGKVKKSIFLKLRFEAVFSKKAFFWPFFIDCLSSRKESTQGCDKNFQRK